MHRNKIRAVAHLLSGMKPIEQRLGLLQIERVEAFGEPAIDRSQIERRKAEIIRRTSANEDDEATT